MRPLVYIAHPLGAGSDREANRARAARWVAWAADRGAAPVADWIILSGQWDESRREDGLAIDFALVAACRAVWLVGGRVSPGMVAEASHARALGIPVVDCTALGAEPPSGDVVGLRLPDEVAS